MQVAVHSPAGHNLQTQRPTRQADVTATRYGDKRMGLNSSIAICECASASRKAARNIHQTIGATVRGCDGWKASPRR